MTNKGMRTVLLAGVALSSILAASGASAQSAPAKAKAETAKSRDAQELEVLVVTARRREENIQAVPVAVTALSGEALRRQNITTANDLQTAVPSLSLNVNRNHQNSDYAIRGLSQGGTLGTETVVTYFNEVPSPTATPAGDAGAGHSLYDLQSVQVLKGPQGTLFGRTATAGAVLVTPKHPVMNDRSGFVQATVGSGPDDMLGNTEIIGAVNLPLVADHLALRASFDRHHQDGYTQIIGGHGAPEDETNSFSARVGLEFQAGSFKNYALVDMFKARETAAAVQIAGVAPALFNFYGAIIPPFAGPMAAIRDTLLAEDARVRSSDDEKRRIHASQYPNINQAETQSFLDVAEWNGDFSFGNLSLKNIFGYQRHRNISALDYGGLGIVVSAYGTASSTIVNGVPNFAVGPYAKFYSNESQLNGALWDNAVQFTLGYYYQNAPLPRNTSGSTNIYNFLSGLFSGGGFTSAYPYNIDGGTTEKAVYGQATVDLGKVGLEGVHLTGGYRKTKDEEKRTTEGFTFDANGTLVPNGVITTAPTLKSSGNGWTVSVDYQPTSDLTLYATARRGYKPGGLNNLVQVVGHDSFGPETVQDYELGAKVQFDIAGVTGHVFTDVYRNDYKNIQRPVLLIGASYVDNVAAARLEGFEIEGSADMQNGWGVDAWYSLNKTEYTEWFAADPLGLDGNIDLSGNPFNNAPKHKASITVRYTQDLGEDNGSVTASVTAYHQSLVWFDDAAQRNIDVFSDPASPLAPFGSLSADYVKSAISQSAYTILNARVDWKRVFGSDLDASVFVTNITDEVYATGGVGGLGTQGFSGKTYAPPRMVGLQLSYHFGS